MIGLLGVNERSDIQIFLGALQRLFERKKTDTTFVFVPIAMGICFFWKRKRKTKNKLFK